MGNTEQKLIEGLRAGVELVSRVNGEVSDLKKQMAGLKRSLEAKAGALSMAIGARDALAKILLPEDMGLSDAWRKDYRGLRTGGMKRPDNVETIETWPMKLK